MSTYTTELRYYINNLLPSGSTLTETQVTERCQAVQAKIFDNYPIWKESERAALNTAILRHFYFREIAQETVGLWKIFINRKMSEIMPYYNKMFQAEDQEFDFLNTVYTDETEVRHNIWNEEGSSTGESDGKQSNTTVQQGKTVNSDLPQTALNGMDYATTSSTTDENSTADTDSSQNVSTNDARARDTNETITRGRKGNNGNKSPTELLVEYRNAILNIYALIMQDLEECFFQLW